VKKPKKGKKDEEKKKEDNQQQEDINVWTKEERKSKVFVNLGEKQRQVGKPHRRRPGVGTPEITRGQTKRGVGMLGGPR